MKLDVKENLMLELKEVFNTIQLTPEKGMPLLICMRDDGFELQYNNQVYFTKDGAIIKPDFATPSIGQSKEAEFAAASAPAQLTGAIGPGKRPQLTAALAAARLAPFQFQDYPVKVLGIRGYYKKTMGNPVRNDIGIYDDALFLVTPDHFSTYNANTDPSVQRKGIATLKPGAYTYRLGLHGIHHLNTAKKEDAAILHQLVLTGEDVPGYTACYWALRQYSRVTVLRSMDGGKTFFEDTDTAAAPFFIDIHRGGINTTSSDGCQTIERDQWTSFFHTIKDQLKRYAQTDIPYALVEY